MPTYQYQCTECGEGLEVFQKFTDDALTACPTCPGTLRKIYSAVGIVFKGSGFYRTDSRAAASSSTPASSDTKSGDQAKAKPAGGATSTGSSSAAAGSSSSGSSSGSASSRSTAAA